MGLGTLLIFIGVALLSARLVRPLVDRPSARSARWVVFAFTVLVWPFCPASVLAAPLRRLGHRAGAASECVAFVVGALLNLTPAP